MLTVLSLRRKSGIPRVARLIVGCLLMALGVPVPARAQPQTPAAGGPSAKTAPADAKGKAPGSTKPASSARDAKGAAAKAAAAPEANPADPSQTPKMVRNEIFRDKRAEELLDLKRFQQIGQKSVPNTDIGQLNAIAGGADPNIDRALIDRVIDAMVTKLTDHANIQALVEEPPPNQRIAPPAARAIQEATKSLLEPIFLARSANPRNQAFLNVYNRALVQKLTPVLKNHLIPRVQAMIILGESGSSDMLPIYEAQIKDPNQTVWVKLWAFQGIANATEQGPRLTGQAQVEAAKVVADFLTNEVDAPWPAQLRALEALTAMRQGFEPNRPKNALMASAAMKLLSDGNSKPEVRAEAARALGFMPINATVPRYNYALVAHDAGQLAAELGAGIGSLITTNAAKVRQVSQKPKAQYLAALLVGPVYQCFDGAPGVRESGLRHATTTGPAAAYIDKIFEMITAIAKVSADVLNSGSRQLPSHEKELAAAVSTLREFLESNAPNTRQLVADGDEYPPPGAATPTPPREQPAAKPARGAPAAKPRRRGP
jgi:hypothetical protein